jgi:hypothetical protein
VKQESPERSGTPVVCPRNLHERGKELQEETISAKEMTALLSTGVQTYGDWTLVANRNGKGGTKQADNGPKAPNIRPKDGNKKQSIKEIGSQLKG